MMLLDSVYLLGGAVLLGTGLAVWYLQSEGRHIPHWSFAALHALVAVTGFALLVSTLFGPPRGLAMGVAGFGRMAAAFLALALLTGLLPLSSRLRHKRLPLPTLVIGLHATFAVFGMVILAAYFSLGG